MFCRLDGRCCLARLHQLKWEIAVTNHVDFEHLNNFEHVVIAPEEAVSDGG